MANEDSELARKARAAARMFSGGDVHLPPEGAKAVGAIQNMSAIKRLQQAGESARKRALVKKLEEK